MDKENLQKELFELDLPKKRTNRFGNLFQKTDFAVSLSAEKLIFVLIGMIMLLVVAFALGVERGKSISQKTPQVVSAKVNVQETAKVPVQVPAKAATSKTPVVATIQQQPAQVKTVQAKAAQPVTTPSVQVQAPVADKGKPYSIVAAAYSKETFAAKEVSRLKTAGFEAFTYYSEPYYLVCVGNFANKDSAQKVLVKIRQMHRDAYVRLK